MTVGRFRTDVRGAAAVELALVAPALIAVLFGALQGALMLWTQLGLQHAAERAARCAAVNASVCGSSAMVQAYAASQELAANIPAVAYTLSNEACGSAVTGTTTVRFVTFAVNLSARSCFPK